MIKKWTQTTATVILVLSLYSLLIYYFDEDVVLYSIIGIGVLTIVGFMIFNYNPDVIIDQSCDVDRYSTAIDKKYKDKMKPEYLVRVAYLYTHKGDFEAAGNVLEQMTNPVFDSKSKEFYIYHTSRMRVLYNNKDIENYRLEYEKIIDAPIFKKEEVPHEVFKAPLLMLEEEYEEALDILFKWIPVQRKRILILELEYYLEQIYFIQGKTEDAVAVAEFMAKRNFNNFYTNQFKKWYDELSENE